MFALLVLPRCSMYMVVQGLAFLSERVQSVKLEGGAATEQPDVPTAPEVAVNPDTKPKE